VARKKNKKHGEEEGGEAWLLPYSDLMTLLLAVFIVLFAVSKIDQEKAEGLAEAFREGMMSEGSGIFSGEGESVVPLNEDEISEEEHHDETSEETDVDENTTDEGTIEEDTANEEATNEHSKPFEEDSNVSQKELEEFLGQYELSNLQDLKKDLDVIFEDKKMTSSITTAIDTRGLVISLDNAILFDSGSADIKGVNDDTLLMIAETINNLDNYIRIEGHTDNIPMKSARYPSNWELSTARAASVVRLFLEEGKVPPDKVVAVGYGEYRPIADNSTIEGRAKNRRIDIIILSEKYDNLEK
jgi:chemotaxis protein MotB